MSDLVKTVQEGNGLDLWKKKDKIRQMFAPNLQADEFDAFVGLGASLGANPFNREIWAVKYGNNPAQIFLGRDFYRRKAQEQPDYNGHQVDAVYSNDTFSMVNGKPQHEYNLMDRGDLVGAYAVVYRSNNEPYFITVTMKEYFKGGNSKPNLWDKTPETMIKKVAEAQALRGAFQGLFAGTYDVSEEWEPNEYPQNHEPLPEAIRHLADRFPYDKTLKTPRNSHKPYLGDGTPKELELVEQDIRDAVIEPRYLRYFYTITNATFDYLKQIPEQMLEVDQAEVE